jgi:ABC-type phosphate/phosphonate transport system substrate-binding protein
LKALLLGLLLAAPLPERISMGYLSDRVEYSVAYMKPALEQFRQKLAPLGVKEVTLEVAPSIEQMGDWVKNGRVDLLVSTPYPVLRTARLAGTWPVLYGEAVRERRSAFVVRADSKIHALDDLAGKRLALTFTYSSPGYFIPILHLLERGFVLDREQAGKKVVYTSLSGHGVNSLYWLYFGKCDAAAVGEDDIAKVAPKLRAAVRVLDTSKPYPGFLALVSPTLSAEAKATLVDFLKKFHVDPVGKKLIEDVYGCKKLEAFPPHVEGWLRGADLAIPKIVKEGGN